MTKTDQEAAEEYAVKEIDANSYDENWELARESFLAGCAHKEKQLEAQRRKDFEAARKHPNWCDPVIIEQYHHDSPGNSAGTYWRAKKINYEYSTFDEWLAKQENLK